MLSCPYCGSNEVYLAGRNRKGEQRHLCRSCNRRFTEKTIPIDRKPRVYHVCLQCGTETKNPRFCSRSCASAYNNVISPKRSPKPRYCKHCNIPLTGRRSVCDDCNPSIVDWSKRTLGEIQDAAKYQINGVARRYARIVHKESGRPRVCHNCGYDKHVEICHIRAINTFPDDTPVSVVSGIDNLIALCPNCHWEFDHGLLRLSEEA